MTLRRLGDAGGKSARDLVESLHLDRPTAAGRPRVAAIMIASVDGRAAVQGRSVALGHPDDRALLRELRTAADAVLVGSATLVAERYRNLLDPDQRARRVALGRPVHPIVATVARRFALPDVPLLHEHDVPLWVFTETEPEGRVPPQVRVVRLERLTFPAVLRALGEAGVHGVSCEGGPRLLRELVAQGCVDDLLVTVAPMLAAGEEPTLLAGPPLAPPASLRLVELHRSDSHAFLHYRPAG